MTMKEIIATYLKEDGWKVNDNIFTTMKNDYENNLLENYGKNLSQKKIQKELKKSLEKYNIRITTSNKINKQ